LKVLFVGDIVGKPGRSILAEELSHIKEEHEIDTVIVNGENAAGGRGITAAIAEELFSYGIDAITMGNHTWDQKELVSYIDKEPRIIRPLNYPPGTPGQGSYIYECKNIPIGVMNLSGRVYLDALDCPFRAAEKEIERLKRETNIILVDFHGEATSEKQAMAWFLDGKVTAVLGTHTHVQTNDARILPMGTAMIADVGMTGPRDSILGRDVKSVVERFLTHMPTRFGVAEGVRQLNAVILDIDHKTGNCLSISYKNVIKE
jgi:metallophosphoesterase (TIGR00282 family)